MRRGLLGQCSRAKKLSIVFREHYYNGILTSLEALLFGNNFEVNFLGVLNKKHAVQRGFWSPTEHLL